MKFLPRLLGLGLLSLLVMLLAMSCESTKTAAGGEFGSPTRLKGEAIAKPDSRQIVHFTDTTTEYKTPRSELARAFIRQFNDGTVVDKIQVRKAPGNDGAPVTYYLIGMGLRGGTFRAMAVPLTSSGDNTYYLRPAAERYTLTSVGCPACFFNFENGRIVGTSCTESYPGSHCDLKVDATNELFSSK